MTMVGFGVWSLWGHRIREWFGLERTIKIIWFHHPCHKHGHLPPAQGAQSSIQPGLEHCQGGGSHSFSGQPGPGPHHPHGRLRAMGAGERAFRCWWKAGCGAAPLRSSTRRGDVSFKVNTENTAWLILVSASSEAQDQAHSASGGCVAEGLCRRGEPWTRSL